MLGAATGCNSPEEKALGRERVDDALDDALDDAQTGLARVRDTTMLRLAVLIKCVLT